MKDLSNVFLNANNRVLAHKLRVSIANLGSARDNLATLVAALDLVGVDPSEWNRVASDANRRLGYEALGGAMAETSRGVYKLQVSRRKR